MDDRTRFTTEQVLRGIQAYVHEQVDEKLVIDPDASVNEYRAVIEESHDCPLMFLEMLAEYFGFHYSEARWVIWLQLRSGVGRSKAELKQGWEHWQDVTSKSITVRKLAEHIARYAPGTSMAPVTVFGVPCAPAGAFKGLCRLSEVGARRVAPSTKLRDVMRGGKLRQFWTKSQWASGQVLPKLAPEMGETWLGRSFALSLFVGFACVVGLFGMRLFDWDLSATFPVLGAAIVLPCILLCWVAAVVDRLRNPLPAGISTFGDLARCIAETPPHLST